MSQTIFITGATGFLGGHFLRLAEEHQWRLRCLTRKPPAKTIPPASAGCYGEVPPKIVGEDSPKSKMSRALARGAPRVEWIKGDVSKGGAWCEKLKGCDILIHLASVPLMDCDTDPALGARSIVGGFREIYKQAIQAGIRRVILASTGEVYGLPSRLPAHEKKTPLLPMGNYGYFKACVDLFAAEQIRDHKISICILRFFNLYGLSADGKVQPSVFNLFADKIMRNEPVILHASYRNSRDFLHIKDAARALVLAVENPKAEGPINIGSGKETLLLEAAKIIARLAGKNLKIDFRPHEGCLRRMAADIGRARKVLKFKPKVSLEEGLKEVLKGRFP